ncbi:hypothetical protein E3N88_14959 [Mikania micrantha]|uniref:Uncharacterized protein n=1 Tax=Mikania micrantha TaxID=192012 RepID=A0A5N6P307_9ASTR|nr:hypothetical protein E3N88_14959 [Mikania micrantha]
MCGDKNHFAADCFYNPRSRMFSEKQGRGRKESWSMSSSSSKEQGRNPVKKVSEASTSNSWKKQDKKGFGKKVSEASTSENQNKKASEKNIWKKKEIAEPSVQPPVPPKTSTLSVPSKMMSKKFTYNDANGKPKTIWAWVPIRN